LFGIFVARYLALAIALGKGWRTSAVLAGALVLSYSGTAWATFFIFLALHFPLVGSLRDAIARVGLVALLACTLTLVFVLREPLGMDRYVARIEELTYPSSQTSGGGRFLAPLRGTSAFLHEASFTQLIFGDGPGTVEDRLVDSGAWGNAGAWTKLIIEYGLVGCVLFVLLFGRAVLRSTRYLPLAVAILAEFLIISPSMLVPSSVYVILIGFCLFVPLEPSDQRRPAANSRFSRPVRALTARQRWSAYTKAPHA
jgi:hypothetical protein